MWMTLSLDKRMALTDPSTPQASQHDHRAYSMPGMDHELHCLSDSGHGPQICTTLAGRPPSGIHCHLIRNWPAACRPLEASLGPTAYTKRLFETYQMTPSSHAWLLLLVSPSLFISFRC